MGECHFSRLPTESWCPVGAPVHAKLMHARTHPHTHPPISPPLLPSHITNNDLRPHVFHTFAASCLRGSILPLYFSGALCRVYCPAAHSSSHFKIHSPHSNLLSRAQGCQMTFWQLAQPHLVRHLAWAHTHKKKKNSTSNNWSMCNPREKKRASSSGNAASALEDKSRKKAGEEERERESQTD